MRAPAAPPRRARPRVPLEAPDRGAEGGPFRNSPPGIPGADRRLAASSDLDVAEPHLRSCVLASRRRHPGIPGAPSRDEPLLTVRDMVDGTGVRVMAAERGLERPVRWVHISELADPTPWLSGGELL